MSAAPVMSIRVLLFAGLADAIGQRTLVVDVEGEITVAKLQEHIEKQWAEAAPLIRQCVVSVNQEYASPEQIVRPQDEVAFIPPVSGGEETDGWCTITEEPLSADALIRRVSNPYAGAVVTFAGTVREFTQGKQTVHLKYEAYTPMAIRKMEEICTEVRQRWPEARIAMSHRIGTLDIEEISVIIAVATPHRPEAFEAGRYALERLKSIVPIWKKEVWQDGSEWKGHQQGPWNPVSP
ncbi:molybdenum cofactor biosynthesis protein D/E [Marinithermofilum abyssi]|uniref:Molybdopterin synthase catalytic subunit n=2 Tax=Marinithermofilum abyssi TaxID=1571185 RepID=A0A8J2VIQ8_9BACL|nr:molybdenum cofactor biosynthesis protein D/E [Marinithermofilum abyssi]